MAVGVSRCGASGLPKEPAKVFCCKQLPVGCPYKPHVKHLPSPAVREALRPPLGDMPNTAEAGVETGVGAGFFSAAVSFIIASNWASAAPASNAISCSIISSSRSMASISCSAQAWSKGCNCEAPAAATGAPFGGCVSSDMLFSTAGCVVPTTVPWEAIASGRTVWSRVVCLSDAVEQSKWAGAGASSVPPTLASARRHASNRSSSESSFKMSFPLFSPGAAAGASFCARH
mmetsp:Transcript_22662/g.43414  ORF Transcript_22662/g.43414 Transcript_22662/m.43414 type:complete len:231 (+) Transcript_22662:1020-1712(+)